MSFLNQREGSVKMRCKNVYFFDIKQNFRGRSVDNFARGGNLNYLKI